MPSEPADKAGNPEWIVHGRGQFNTYDTADVIDWMMRREHLPAWYMKP